MLRGRADAGVLRSIGSPAQANAPQPRPAAPSEGQLSRSAECRRVQNRPMLRGYPTALDAAPTRAFCGASACQHKRMLRNRAQPRPAKASSAQARNLGWPSTSGCSAAGPTQAFCGASARPAPANAPRLAERARCGADACLPRSIGWPGTSGCSAAGPTRAFCGASAGPAQADAPRIPAAAPSEGQLGRGAECQLAQHKRMLRNRARPHPAKASSAEARNLGSSSTRGCSAAGPSALPVALTRAFCGTLARPAQADGPQPRPAAPSEGQLSRGAECRLVQNRPMLRGYPTALDAAPTRAFCGASARQQKRMLRNHLSRRPAQPRLGASARPEPANAPRLPDRAQRRPAQLRRGTSAGPAQADAPRPG